jgi:hypothetical protein
MRKRKSEKPRFYGQNKKNLSTLPFSPWAVSTTWLHVGVPQKIQEKLTQYPFSTKIHHGSYGVGIGRAWYSRKYIVHSSKFLYTSCPNNNRPVFGLKEI